MTDELFGASEARLQMFESHARTNLESTNVGLAAMSDAVLELVQMVREYKVLFVETSQRIPTGADLL